jgi:hypothetical protein
VEFSADITGLAIHSFRHLSCRRREGERETFMYALVNPSKLTCSLKDDTKCTILTFNEQKWFHSNECVSNFWEKSPPQKKIKKLLCYYLFTSVKTVVCKKRVQVQNLSLFCSIEKMGSVEEPQPTRGWCRWLYSRYTVSGQKIIFISSFTVL